MHFVKAYALFAALLPLVAAAPSPRPSSAHPSKRYIVVLKDHLSNKQAKEHTHWVRSVHAKNKKRSGSGANFAGVEKEYSIHKFQGYAGSFDDSTLAEIESHPEVDFIEPDFIAELETLVRQHNSTWGLGDISHKAGDMTQYVYDDSAGEGMWAYVIDSGINVNHTDFQGRAELGYNPKGGDNVDESGHGTHVAGTIVGRRYGVAKKARAVNIKVFGGRTTPGSVVIDGFNWAVDDIIKKERAGISVINMSLTTNFSRAFNAAVDNAWAQGIISVCASGNSNTTSENRSPASAEFSVTVGATDRDRKRARYSNYGSTVNIMAPGTNVTSASHLSNNGTRTISGTSHAAPHVAGVILYLKKLHSLLGHEETLQKLYSTAQKGVLREDSLLGSPNLLAYNGNDRF